METTMEKTENVLNDCLNDLNSEWMQYANDNSLESNIHREGIKRAYAELKLVKLRLGLGL